MLNASVISHIDLKLWVKDHQYFEAYAEWNIDLDNPKLYDLSDKKTIELSDPSNNVIYYPLKINNICTMLIAGG